ncbi:MAG: DUF2061 domain-containing protein [Thermodesulfobacteriota bacterium]
MESIACRCELARRSLVKTVTWRLMAFALTLGISLLLTRDGLLSLKLSVGANLVKSLFFYLHERTWNRISWGRGP